MKKNLPLLFFILFSFFIVSCGEKPSVEVIIKENVSQAKEGIETLKPSLVTELLAENFSATSHSKAHGKQKMQAKDIKKIMQVQALRKQKVSLTLSPVKVTMDEFNSTLAHMETTAIITSRRSGLIPNDGRIYKIKGTWRLFDDEWLLTDISWE